MGVTPIASGIKQGTPGRIRSGGNLFSRCVGLAGGFPPGRMRRGHRNIYGRGGGRVGVKILISYVELQPASLRARPSGGPSGQWPAGDGVTSQRFPPSRSRHVARRTMSRSVLTSATARKHSKANRGPPGQSAVVENTNYTSPWRGWWRVGDPVVENLRKLKIGTLHHRSPPGENVVATFPWGCAKTMFILKMRKSTGKYTVGSMLDFI